MTADHDPAAPREAADSELPLTRETLLALRDGRLPREQARNVRARLSRDSAALALLGTLGSTASEHDEATQITGEPAPLPPSAAALHRGSDSPLSTGMPSPRVAGTKAQRAVLIVAAAAVLAAGLLWAGHAAVEPPDPRAAPVVPQLSMSQLGSLWPGIDGRFDRDLLDSRGTRCQPFKTPLGAQGAVVDGRYSMVVAYTADGTLRDDEIALVVVPLNCNDSDYYPRVTVPR